MHLTTDHHPPLFILQYTIVNSIGELHLSATTSPFSYLSAQMPPNSQGSAEMGETWVNCVKGEVGRGSWVREKAWKPGRRGLKMELRTRWDAGDQLPLSHCLLPASPNRCPAFDPEPTMNSKAERLWPGLDPAGPFVGTGFSAGAFPLSLPHCCSPAPSPSLWHIFNFLVY